MGGLLMVGRVRSLQTPFSLDLACSSCHRLAFPVKLAHR